MSAPDAKPPVAPAAGIEGRFGPYGGRYVPEVLIAALDELTAAFAEARSDPGFRAELDQLLRDFVGRPTPLYAARRLSERVGRRVYLKREDLAHTGAHKINNAVGQALLARRMGKGRIIAETGAGQHGVATATACALFGLECVVYMGTEDMRRQRPNVERMELMGATVEPVEAGARTLKEAVSAAIRDWVTNVGDTHYIIGSAVGPAPYPALVRDLQRVIGDEAREQILGRGGGAAGPGDRLRRRRLERDRHLRGFLEDEGVELIGVEAAGEGLDGRHGASLAAGRTGVLHGALSSVIADDEGQILEAHSISAGLDYPGVGPEHAQLRDSGRARYEAVTDAAALDAFALLSRLEGIVPALESSHAIAWLLAAGAQEAASGGEGVDLLTLSGRGDKDLDEALAALDERDASLAERRRADRRGLRGRPRGGPGGPDAVPDGGLPGPRDLARRGRRLRRWRRRPDRARRPLLGPARRRPGDPRRRDRGAARRGPRSTTCSRSAPGWRRGFRCCRWST